MALVLPSLPSGHAPTGAEIVTLEAAITQAYGVRAGKTSTQTVNNSATLVNDTEMFWAVEANAIYDLDILLLYNSNATADFKWAWTYPTGLTMAYSVLAFNTASTLFIDATFTESATVNAGGDGTDLPVWLKGSVIVGSTAGTLQLQWAQNTANASNTTLNIYSRGVLRKI